jgi:hypothetical protein
MKIGVTLSQQALEFRNFCQSGYDFRNAVPIPNFTIKPIYQRCKREEGYAVVPMEANTT